jgi:DNA-binding IclR family transcriptional regulator
MNSLRRMLAVLQLIRADRPLVDIDDIRGELGYAPATAYRYLRELVGVGLLVRWPGGYGLGPRIIEYDLMIRESDPLLNRSRELVRALARQTGLNVLLSELFEDTVISIHQEYGVDPGELNFGRGRPMPLFRSATSRVILAHLPPRRLRRLHDSHAGSAELQALGADWGAFAQAMRAIRRQGWCRSSGELDPGKTGLAAPIFDDAQRVIGSITLVGHSARFDAIDADALCRAVVEAGREITRRVAAGGSLGG